MAIWAIFVVDEQIQLTGLIHSAYDFSEGVLLQENSMATILPSSTAPSGPSVEPRRRLWTREEYHHMVDLGWFDGQRVELVEGEIVQMSPQKNRHAVATELCRGALAAGFGSNYWIRIQLPLELSPQSLPEPDLAVVPGNPRQFKEHPAAALLVVEVSDTTLAFDRRVKSRLYAAAGIADYWIVNLIDRQLEVFRRPAVDPAEPSKAFYDEQFVLSPDQSIAPLACSSSPIRLSDLLP
jgi:Uma2 family endonuclease